MIIKTDNTAVGILDQGVYLAKMTSFKGIPNDEKPVKIAIGFKPDGSDEEITKELPYNNTPGTPFSNDMETMTDNRWKEVSKNFNSDTLLGKQFQIVVAHKSSAGGKPKAVVSVIMAAPQASLPIQS